MGRTLWGVDLDESPAGGLIERLLTDEELAKLADGGHPADDGTDDDADDGSGGDGDGSVDSSSSTDDGHARDGRDADGTADPTWDRGDEFAWQGETASTFDDEPVDESDEGGLRDRIGETRLLLLKAAVGLAVLSVLAVLLWRYLGRFVEAAPTDRFGGGSDEDATTRGAPDVDEDAPPARRRAKAGAVADEDDEVADLTDAFDDLGGEREADADEDDDSDDAPDRAVDDGVDLGALVGLATLALIAAVVRKFGEQAERDPLADGPE